MRERWVCPKCGHTEDLLPGTKYVEHIYKKGILRESHVLKKEKKS